MEEGRWSEEGDPRLLIIACVVGVNATGVVGISSADWDNVVFAVVIIVGDDDDNNNNGEDMEGDDNEDNNDGEWKVNCCCCFAKRLVG